MRTTQSERAGESIEARAAKAFSSSFPLPFASLSCLLSLHSSHALTYTLPPSQNSLASKGMELPRQRRARSRQALIPSRIVIHPSIPCRREQKDGRTRKRPEGRSGSLSFRATSPSGHALTSSRILVGRYSVSHLARSLSCARRWSWSGSCLSSFLWAWFSMQDRNGSGD